MLRISNMRGIPPRNRLQNLVTDFASLGESLVAILTFGQFRANWTLPLMGWFLDREFAKKGKKRGDWGQ